MATIAPMTIAPVTKKLSEMTRADWLTRRWVEATPPGSLEMFFTDAGDFPPAQRAALLRTLHAGATASDNEQLAARDGAVTSRGERHST